jgi:hypothetical protein
MTEIGIVESFNINQKCGFIKNINTNISTFCNLKNKQTILYPGEYVSFDYKNVKNFKLECINITGVGGGSLLCENKHYNYKVTKKNTNKECENEDVDIAFILASIDNGEIYL